MNAQIRSIILTFAVFNLQAYGQGTFNYDQQSATETNVLIGGHPAIQDSEPMGQSFTPVLPSVGFVRFFLQDGQGADGMGASVYVNLRADSITGTILASTDPVYMPNLFGGPTNFFFSSPVTVTPGTTYFFQPVVQSGSQWLMLDSTGYNYAGGMAYLLGGPVTLDDFWFREGIYTPEPSTWALLLTGAGLFYLRRRR